jgi:hypothetical protein
LIVYPMGKNSTLNIPTVITTSYIEKVVFRIGRGWSTILTRTLRSNTATAWVTHEPENDPIGPPPIASGDFLVGEGSVAFANALLIRPGQIFNLSDLGLLVVYDARFKDSKIYGFIGGSEKPDTTKAVFNHTRTAESCFNCPRCEAPVVAGQLICFHAARFISLKEETDFIPLFCASSWRSCHRRNALQFESPHQRSQEQLSTAEIPANGL